MTAAVSMMESGRELAESLMLDTCKITRASDSTHLDPDTGLPVKDPPETIYSGKCKVQSRVREVASDTAGEHVYDVQRLDLHIPVSAVGVDVGDDVEITESSTDPAQVGNKFRVTGRFRKTFATAQRLPIEEVVS